MYHFRWVETHDAIELLLPSDSFASYRPLPSLVWYLWRHTVGFYSLAGFTRSTCSSTSPTAGWCFCYPGG